MKKLIAGNWKMNGSAEFSCGIMNEILSGISGNSSLPGVCDFLVFPPFPYLSLAVELGQGVIAVGAQDCSVHASGAYTGEVSASMIGDCGAKYALVGHSERRQYHGETDQIVADKAKTAIENSLIALICVGETEAERESGAAKAVVARQIAKSLPADVRAENTVVAYEPVWAIGTGKTASVEDVREMHAFIRHELCARDKALQSLRILYGGSMRPENAAEILAVPDVDGGLIGGASLKAESFLAIATAAVSKK